jgi:hypothetical protein
VFERKVVFNLAIASGTCLAVVVVVVRGRVELPTFRFSVPDIPAVTPVLGGKSGVAAVR